MRMNRIWLKFMVSYVIVIMVVLIIWATTSSVFIRQHLYKESIQQLVIRGEEVSQEFLPANLQGVDNQFLQTLSKRYKCDLYLTDIQGKYIASSLKDVELNLRISGHIWDDISKGEYVNWVWEKPPSQEAVIAVAIPMYRQNRFAGAFVLTSPVRGMEAAMKALHHQLFRGGLIAFLLGFILSLGVSYSMTRQIRQVSIGVRHFAAENLSYRIPIVTRDELGEIAGSFNHMAEQIELNNKRRQSMLAGVSHEVRTPLTNICGYIEAMRDGVLPENKQEETLELIYAESEFLKRMVNDLIELSRMSSGNYEIYPTRFEVAELVTRVVRRLENIALAKKDTIINLIEPGLMMFGDEVRLEQLFNNLVKNALQYTYQGEVKINGWSEGDNLQFAVEDNGIGIDQQQLAYVFDSFYKVDSSRAREYEESGLGLTICEAIVKLHGGNIKITSQLNRGTRVDICFPHQKSS